MHFIRDLKCNARNVLKLELYSSSVAKKKKVCVWGGGGGMNRVHGMYSSQFTVAAMPPLPKCPDYRIQEY